MSCSDTFQLLNKTLFERKWRLEWRRNVEKNLHRTYLEEAIRILRNVGLTHKLFFRIRKCIKKRMSWKLELLNSNPYFQLPLILMKVIMLSIVMLNVIMLMPKVIMLSVIIVLFWVLSFYLLTLCWVLFMANVVILRVGQCHSA